VTVRRHAEKLVGRRLTPAQPPNDGRQTPYRGHPVFVAQHATATCCRTCLARWHDISAGHALDVAERGYRQAGATTPRERWPRVCLRLRHAAPQGQCLTPIDG
jgi:uncharacterized protein DUF4186